MRRLNLPIILTLIRLGISVAVLPFLMFFLLPYNNFWISKTLVFIFAAVSFTDFLDGYIARNYNQETILGRILDPLADKCFVITSLVTLVALQRLSLPFALIIIMREFIVTGIRTLSLQYGFFLPSSAMGKWKTTLQYLYLLFMVGMPWGIAQFYTKNIEALLLFGMIVLSIISGIQYCRYFAKWWCNVKVNKKGNHEV